MNQHEERVFDYFWSFCFWHIINDNCGSIAMSQVLLYRCYFSDSELGFLSIGHFQSRNIWNLSCWHNKSYATICVNTKMLLQRLFVDISLLLQVCMIIFFFNSFSTTDTSYNNEYVHFCFALTWF